MKPPVGSVVAIMCAWNEGKTVGDSLRQFPRDMVDRIVLVNDGSEDDTSLQARNAGAFVIDMPTHQGISAGLRAAFAYVLKEGFDVAVFVSITKKDDPRHIERLLRKLDDEKADFVQGSRYLEGGGFFNAPMHRRWGVPAFSFLFSCLAGRWFSDATNGFRALRLSILKDPRINMEQEWLHDYGMETYLFFKILMLKYKISQVGVTKTYPPKGTRKYTKMRPFVDWWGYFRPALFLRLGLKK